MILTVTPDDAGLAVFGLDFAVKGSALAATVCWMKSRMDQYSLTPLANEAKIEASPHSADSSLREQALGHLFLGQLLAFMWRNGARDIEVLKSEVDRGGYDVVLEANGVIRHVQLKSSFRGSKVREVEVSTRLLRKPGGCVLWLEFDRESLAIERFYWFGGKAGEQPLDFSVVVFRVDLV